MERNPGQDAPPDQRREEPGVDRSARTDQALVRAIRGGEPGAWEALLSRYQGRLFAVCVRMVGDRDRAADLTQDAMVKVIQGLGTYDGRSKLSTWMIRVTMNVCLSHLRSEKHRRHASLDAMRSENERASGSSSSVDRALEGREPSAAAGVEHEDRRRQVVRALMRLEPEQRALLVLRDVQGLDYEQIAEVFRVPLGTIKSRLFRSRAALREQIESEETDEHRRG